MTAMTDADVAPHNVSKPEKSADAFRTISEVSSELDVPQHVLRFWETKFSQVKPLKRAGGRRYYRPEDIVLLRCIRDLLYAEGYTIRGVQKLLREKGARGLVADSEGGPAGEVAVPMERPVAQTPPPPVSAVNTYAPPVAGEGAATLVTLDGGIRAELKSVMAELEDLRSQVRSARRS